MARPYLPRAALRRPMTLYVNPCELTQLQAKAEEARLPLSTFLRRAALGHRISSVPAGSAQRWADLGRLGNNINQLARKANAGELLALEEDALLLQALLNEIHALRNEIAGSQERES